MNRLMIILNKYYNKLKNKTNKKIKISSKIKILLINCKNTKKVKFKIIIYDIKFLMINIILKNFKYFRLK